MTADMRYDAELIKIIVIATTGVVAVCTVREMASLLGKLAVSREDLLSMVGNLLQDL